MRTREQLRAYDREYKRKLREKRRRTETPEEREKRLAWHRAYYAAHKEEMSRKHKTWYYGEKGLRNYNRKKAFALGPKAEPELIMENGRLWGLSIVDESSIRNPLFVVVHRGRKRFERLNEDGL